MELLVCVRVYREKFIYEEYKYTDHVFAVVKSGSFYLKSGDSECVVGENEATVFLPGTTYYRKVIKPLTMYLFRFTTSKKMTVGFKMTFDNIERIKSNISMLETLNTASCSNEHKYRKHILEDFFVQYFWENLDYSFGEVPHDEIMQAVVSEIKNSIHQKIDLTQVARSAGLSYVCFARRFKAYTGITPSDYISKERMNLARDFLLNSNLLIKDIAIACGFENEYYFSNFFKKYNGVSPSEFRKNIM